MDVISEESEVDGISWANNCVEAVAMIAMKSFFIEKRKKISIGSIQTVLLM